MILGQRRPHERGGEARAVAARREPGERVWIVRQPEPARRLERAVVEERPRFAPDALDLAHEDVGADVADALELLQQLALARRIPAGGVTQAAQVAAVGVDEVPRGVLEHVRRALVIARVAGTVQRLRALRPGRVCQLARRGPAVRGERTGGGDPEVGGDPRAQQQRGAEEPEEGRRAAAVEPDADLLGVRRAVALEQRPHDGSRRSGGHPAVASAARAGGLARAVLLQRPRKLVLAHPRAALDPGALRVLVELLLGLAGVDAAVGRGRPLARLPAALGRLRVRRALAVLQLPVVAALLGDVLDRRIRGPVGALLAVVLLVRAVERLRVGPLHLLRRTGDRAGKILFAGWHLTSPSRSELLRPSRHTRRRAFNPSRVRRLHAHHHARSRR